MWSTRLASGKTAAVTGRSEENQATGTGTEPKREGVGGSRGIAGIGNHPPYLATLAASVRRWAADAVRRPEPSNKLSLVEREEILTVVNQPEYASLSPTQIVPRHLGLDRVFAAADETLDAQMSPGKQGQTQVDGRGVQGVDCILQTDREIVSAVKFVCFANQKCSQICLDMPVVPLVSINQYQAPDENS